MSDNYFRDSHKAFENAIEEGFLSIDETQTNYAGKYMYMHSHRNEYGTEIDSFKNIETRKYMQVF